MMQSQNNKQTWLVLSHAFNMDGRAASQTITDKIPHLLALGIKPIIISGVSGKKDSMLEHHQVLPALPVGLKFDLRHFLKNRISSPILYQLAMFIIFLVIFPFYLLEKIIIPIETSWSWSISAYFTGRKIIKKNRPALIYSTGGAYAAHLAGYWLSRRYNIPWIVEIHDPMVLESQHARSIREKFLVWLEKTICTHADIVWWFTGMALERAKKRHPRLEKHGHYVIPGVDAPDFNRTSYHRSEHLVIGHFGSLSETRNLHRVLDALRIFIAQDPTRANQLRLHLYGGSMDSVSASAIRAFPYRDVIHNFGRLETNPVTMESGRDQILKLMNAADCLLLLHGTEPFCEEYIPSKLYEYLWTQRPILGLVYRNPQLTNMLRAFNHWSVDENNTDQISLVLEELYQCWSQDKLQDSQVTSPYTTYSSVQEIYSWTSRLLNTQASRN